jgi:hypothetical protein
MSPAGGAFNSPTVEAGFMASQHSKTSESVSVSLDPGICGFTCRITARKEDNRRVTVAILESECRQIQKMSASLTGLTLKELFLPITRNPVYLAAERAGCHLSCGIPLAVVKAAEVALGTALPKDVTLRFDGAEKAQRPPEPTDA